jgi:hypothetical protein
MKTMRTLLVFAGTIIAAAFVSGQTVTEFIIAKINDNYQTQNGSTVAGDLYNQGDTDPYGIFAQVTGTGLTGTYTFTPPGGSAINISTVETGALAYENAFAYATSGALNTAFADGDYSMQINTSGGLQNITLFSLTGSVYPNVPEITGATWSGGKLFISDPTQAYTLNFTAFSGMGGGDKIMLGIDDVFDTSSTSSVTSFIIPANSFTFGQTTSGELNFAKVIDTDTSIAGATGFTAYVSILSFQIQVIPEPSTYAAIFGGLALAGVMIHRRRRAA